MAEEAENGNNYFPTEELEFDAEVTTIGIGAMEDQRGPGPAARGLDGLEPALQSNENYLHSVDEDRQSTISSPGYLYNLAAGAVAHDGPGPGGAMDQYASLQVRLDQAHNAVLQGQRGHDFLYESCKKLNNEVKELRQRNDELMRRQAELTIENRTLKDVINQQCGEEEMADHSNQGALVPDCFNVPPKPAPTTSIGHEARNVDPMAVHIRQEGLGAGPVQVRSEGSSDAVSNDGADNRRVPAKEPSPEECASYLAGIIQPGNLKDLLRNLNMSGVDIDDIVEQHRSDPKEQRIAGITKGLQQLRGNRITGLVDALERTGLRYQVDKFCEEFKIERRPMPVLPPADEPSPQPSQIPAPDPQNKLEEALKPFLKDFRNLPLITDEVKKERRLTNEDKKKFKAAFVSWKPQQKSKFDEFCVSLSLLGVLNAWASVELAQYSDRDKLPEYSVECLTRSCRSIGRMELLANLKALIHDGVVGPCEQRATYLRVMPHTLKHDIIALLNQKRSDGKDWRALAEKVGFNNRIAVWQSENKPAEHFWDEWTLSKQKPTVGYLYDWSLKNNQPDIVARMEDELPQ